MGFFTLLLLGAIFVGSNGQDMMRQGQDFRQVLEPIRQILEPIRQISEPIRQISEPIRRIPSQYDRIFEKQSFPNGLYMPSQQQLPSQYQMPSQYQIPSQYNQKSSQQQVAAQQLPKSSGEPSTSGDKLRQSLETQEQALYAQEILKNEELAKKQSGSRGVTTVCVQVHSDHGNPVVCGPQISSGPGVIQNYKTSSQEQPLPQDKPLLKPTFTTAPVRTQALMRVPMYSLVDSRDYAPQPQPLSLTCQAASPSPLNRFTTNYRLSSPLPVPTEYGLSLGLNGESRQNVLPDGTINPYNWGAPLSKSAALDRNLMQGQLSNADLKLRQEQLDQPRSQLRTSETPFMNFYSDSLAKSIEDVMRASENAGSSASYMSTMPGYERSNDQTALESLEESREKLRKLTRELEEVKKARAAEEAERAAEQQKQQTSQQQVQKISEEDRKRASSLQEPLRPAQVGEREIRQ